MPLCFCFSHGCNLDTDCDGKPVGVLLGTRLVEQHRQDDRVAGLLRAEKLAEKAVGLQRQRVSEHILAETLADSLTRFVEKPGGRLWSRNSSSSPTDSLSPFSRGLSSPSDPLPPTSNDELPRSRDMEVLSSLKCLEAEANDLILKTTKQLKNVAVPPSARPNTAFPLVSNLHTVEDLQNRLTAISLKSPLVLSCKAKLTAGLGCIEDKLKTAKRQWIHSLDSMRVRQTPKHGEAFSTAHHYEPVLESSDPIFQVTFFMLITCHVILGVGRRGCNFLLSIVGYIVQLTIQRCPGKLSSHDRKLLADIPCDSRYAEDRFNLTTNATIYAVCPNPNCHAIHKPVFESGSPIPVYPKACSYVEFAGGSQCGTALLVFEKVEGKPVGVPIKRFVAFSFKDWLGGLLSRPGLEDVMDKAWERCKIGGEDRQMNDVFDGDMLRSFCGPDGKHFSLGGCEGRYTFSLGVDFFNPLGNKQSGKKKSIGMVSLVCENLPINIRYQPENMFLYGVVPGPNEPPLTCLNHYISPLVDELEVFWNPGVRFTRTFNCFYGRVVLAALVCVVCDLLAARKTIGFASIKHTQMCAMCRCTRKSHGLGNTQTGSWVRRTKDEFIAAAERHRLACDHKSRQEIVDETGMRWSVLLRLPYFDPSRFAVVDAMHNLFLGIVQEHYEILGIRLENKEPPAAVDLSTALSPQSYTHLKTTEQTKMRSLIRTLEGPIRASLHTTTGWAHFEKKLNSIQTECLRLAIQRLQIPLLPASHQKRTKTYKIDYIKALLTWRRDIPENSGSQSEFKRGHIFTEEDVKALRTDIRDFVTPSWLTSIPMNLGEPSHGKLKADQWRTLGTVYLPVSLVRLWAPPHRDNPQQAGRQKLLSLTLSLVSAINIASLRTTSRDKANLYTRYMTEYLEGLRNLMPDYQFRPNHHMALHLSEYLLLYGPVHGWWTFPFERLIGILQDIPNNFKNGQLEETIATSFVKSANLRALLAKSECPEAIKNCQAFFRKLVDPEVRNTLLTDISVFTSQLEPEFTSTPTISFPPSTIRGTTFRVLEKFLCDINKTPILRMAKTLSYYTVHGRTFSIAARHKGNGSVLVRHQSSMLPAEIEDIVRTSDDQIFVAVRYFHPTNVNDPFKAYPALRISLWDSNLGQLVIVRAEDICGHFASISLLWEGCRCNVVVSLSRVD